MQALLAVSRGIDAVTAFVGRAVKWLILVAVLVSAGNAIIRKAFDTSSNAWLELQWYLFGAVFMLAAAYTLQRNEHIRIDVLSSRLSKRTRDWIDLVCHIVFLLPFVGMMVWLSTPFLIDSYASQEMSMNAGGLIIWPAKAIILAGFILLLAQAFSEIIKRAAVIAGLIDEPYPQHAVPPLVQESMGGDQHGGRGR
ncbi:TRAP-type mannitol/chloroaromatic compound transport system permease small subunit [Dongia mobilis]|uniref:TRAP transporter small permease protein n=1 Tax=Dongia mobilis TaxID=578943 RepID=A0A4R6WV59_9PROT|nr:TRAP transporter small permease subunit [Dongia mobilis]TDQ80989.1 TRAP-type mannitol/chloroaromatic compound transport system permease small subunit [Dongia mobilis]